jgi:hypothetical protein
MVKLGAFDDGIEHYTTVAKLVNDRVLTAEDKTKLGLWQQFVGLGSLGGYRNPPYPGFDIFKEARALADGGLEMYFPPGVTFADGAKVLDVAPVPTDFLSYHDYVVSGKWMTSGACSVGRLQLSVQREDGTWKEKSIKARKNFVLDCVDVEQLYRDSLTATEQRNTVIVKSELGKIRLAVAGDMYTYLKMAWVTYLTGGAYLKWPGSSLNETPREQLTRMRRFLEKVAAGPGLPYDYAAFDHQPPTSELLTLWASHASLARANVPGDARVEFEGVVNNVAAGFEHATLSVHEGESELLLQILGGLMSGLGITSIVGNAWNTVKTELARNLLSRCGRDISKMTSDVRGDDSAIFDPDPVNLVLMNEAYKALGVKGGEGKFSVQAHGMEFLRVWFSDVCSGYPARAIPGLVQRKPWSNEPWEDVAVVRSIHDVCAILRRRGCEMDQVWRSLRSSWCRFHSIPVSALCVPTSMGGWGVEQWDRRTELVRAVPRLNKLGFRATAATDWRKRRWEAIILDLGVQVETGASEALASVDLNETVGADDVPVAARASRDAWNKLRRSEPVKTRQSALTTQMQFHEAWFDDRIEFAYARAAALTAEGGTYGAYRHLAGKIKLVQQVTRYSPTTLSTWLKSNEPGMYGHLAKLRKHNHIGVALDWLLGTMPVVLDVAHPLSKSFVEATCVANVYRSGTASIAKRFAASVKLAERVFVECPLAKRLLSW